MKKSVEIKWENGLLSPSYDVDNQIKLKTEKLETTILGPPPSGSYYLK
jgi:hypothetical protein